MTLPRLILASGSPRRRALLAAMGAEFTVAVSDVDEEAIARQARPGRPDEIVTLLAEAKARAVARTRGAASEPDALVVGADTIVWLDGAALNKPRDPADAAAMLRRLSGRAHTVYTGVAVVPTGECALRPALTGYDAAEVAFHPLTEEQIAAYVATGEPMDKAGAYGIQDSATGARLVAAVRGDYYTVVGLPLAKLRELLSPWLPEFPAPLAQPSMPFPITAQAGW